MTVGLPCSGTSFGILGVSVSGGSINTNNGVCIRSDTVMRSQARHIMAIWCISTNTGSSIRSNNLVE